MKLFNLLMCIKSCKIQGWSHKQEQASHLFGCSTIFMSWIQVCDAWRKKSHKQSFFCELLKQTKDYAGLVCCFHSSSSSLVRRSKEIVLNSYFVIFPSESFVLVLVVVSALVRNGTQFCALVLCKRVAKAIFKPVCWFKIIIYREKYILSFH